MLLHALHAVTNASIRSFIHSLKRASDLQLVLHHVKGVVGVVHLLDAVDELLLRLGVDGLLPQLPLLLLKEGERTPDRQKDRETKTQRECVRYKFKTEPEKKRKRLDRRGQELRRSFEDKGRGEGRREERT